MRTEGGRTYTAFPCVALVNPGDRYDYLLRFVNAGTEPATAMRSSTGSRCRVTRASCSVAPTAAPSGTTGRRWPPRRRCVGSGALTTTYADTRADLRTADLLMGNNVRRQVTWAAPFGPDAVAAQLRVPVGDPARSG